MRVALQSNGTKLKVAQRIADDVNRGQIPVGVFQRGTAEHGENELVKRQPRRETVAHVNGSVCVPGLVFKADPKAVSRAHILLGVKRQRRGEVVSVGGTGFVAAPTVAVKELDALRVIEREAGLCGDERAVALYGDGNGEGAIFNDNTGFADGVRKF